MRLVVIGLQQPVTDRADSAIHVFIPAQSRQDVDHRDEGGDDSATRSPHNDTNFGVGTLDPRVDTGSRQENASKQEI
jgi:hypothetical protein